MARKVKAAEGRKFKIYDNGGTVVEEGASPIKLTGLKPSSTYNYMCTAVENGVESEKVAVPTITTTAATVPITGFTLANNDLGQKVADNSTYQNKVTYTPENTTQKELVINNPHESNVLVTWHASDNEIHVTPKNPTSGVVDIEISSKAKPELKQVLKVEVIAAP